MSLITNIMGPTITPLMGIKQAINWVAQLDGATQYWQFSDGITVNQSNTTSLKCRVLSNKILSQSHIFDYNQDKFFKLVVRDDGKAFALLGDGTDWVYFVTSQSRIDNGVTHEIELLIGSGFFEIHIDGSLEGQQALLSFVDLKMDRLGVRSSLNQYYTGVIFDFSLTENNTLTNEIPLTNKSQGATQLATVGNVNATMIDYNESVWVKELDL